MMSYPIRKGQNVDICSSILVFISQAINYNIIDGICCKLLWNVTTGGSDTECVTE
jgi:hypothetical protein